MSVFLMACGLNDPSATTTHLALNMVEVCEQRLIVPKRTPSTPNDQWMWSSSLTVLGRDVLGRVLAGVDVSG